VVLKDRKKPKVVFIKDGGGNSLIFSKAIQNACRKYRQKTMLL
jgi:hypothetical protein